MQSHIADFREAGAEVLAVSADSIADSLNLSNQLGIAFPLLSDSRLRAIDAFGVKHAKGRQGESDIARPATFLLDREGVVRWRDLTDNWRIRVRPERLLEELKRIP